MARSNFRTAKEIFEDLSKQGPLFKGLIRSAEHSSDEVEFSVGKTGADWIAISVKDIENVSAISNVRIEENDYSYVSIRLRVPSSGIGLVYARIAGALNFEDNSTSPQANNLINAPLLEFHSSGRCWDSKNKVWYDCPPYRLGL